MHGCTPLVLVLSLTPGHPIHLGAGVEMDWWEEKHTSTRAHPHVGKSTVSWDLARVIPQCTDKQEHFPQEKVALTVGCGHKEQLWKQKTYFFSLLI